VNFSLLRIQPVLFMLCGAVYASSPGSGPVALSTLQLRIQYATSTQDMTFESRAPLKVSVEGAEHELSAGRWRLEATKIRKARQRFHVYTKTFQPEETAEMAGYLTHWKSGGYTPEVNTFGKQLKTDSRLIVDNRVHWISMARFDTQKEAKHLKSYLETNDIWAWIGAETVEPGSATLKFINEDAKTILKCKTPFTVQTNGDLTLLNMKNGFWKQSRENRKFSTPVVLETGAEGALELFGFESLESYLKGVLPAEMPTSWPVEALKAQAVAARSEILASLAGKHHLAGYDFCTNDHCRAYIGIIGQTNASDAAVDASQGEVLIHASSPVDSISPRIVPTVFSANCGGITESNEHVWSGPINTALRSTPDTGKSAGPRSLKSRLTRAEQAYCSSDKNYFRWSQTFSADELTKLINKNYSIGRLQAIETGGRGKSGRLTSVKVVGSKKSVTIQKELAIRLAFGGLSSAMFTVEVECGEHGPLSFTFNGGGRGHGVGLCQQGARGMALQGHDYLDMLKHYFADIKIVRLQ
jgi:SpoIID/LytB domain protein